MYMHNISLAPFLVNFILFKIETCEISVNEFMSILNEHSVENSHD